MKMKDFLFILLSFAMGIERKNAVLFNENFFFTMYMRT
jgi:hypothetical protein